MSQNVTPLLYAFKFARISYLIKDAVKLKCLGQFVVIR